MSVFKYFSAVPLMLILFVSVVSETAAQQIGDYPELAMKRQAQALFFDFIVLPGNRDSTVTFSSVFSLPYSYLPFKRSRESNAQGDFKSTVNLNMEVFNSTEEKLGKKHISIDNLEPAESAFWADTAYAKSYEQSQSNNQFLSGHLDVSLKPGIYSYILQMNKVDGSEQRISRALSIRIKPYSETETGDIIIGKDLIRGEAETRFKLMSLGDNIIFGQDFYILAHIPGYQPESKYLLEIVRANDSDKQAPRVFMQDLTNKHLRENVYPSWTNDQDGNLITLHTREKGYAYALVKVPGSTLPNNQYRMRISGRESGQVVAQSAFNTLWIDMPTSLLSLNVSIDMLRFIVNEETLAELSSGSRAEREQKFRTFWEQRDPTPNTAFNELMAEYYRRIDYAYEHFSSSSLPGYETDQGKIYISYGPPQNVERKFPPDGATTEIWHYPNRRFIFKATSGFGDFKLISD